MQTTSLLARGDGRDGKHLKYVDVCETSTVPQTTHWFPIWMLQTNRTRYDARSAAEDIALNRSQCVLFLDQAKCDAH